MAWSNGGGVVRTLISFALALLSFSFLAPFVSSIPFRFSNASLTAAGFIFFVIREWQKSQEAIEQQLKVAAAEKRVQDHPKETIAAWELARLTLDAYVKRNLSQVRSIFVLTAIVMTCGFAMIVFGSYKAFSDPSEFKASVLSSVSGVVVTFLGGTFLVLYKSTMTQAKDYASMLERINAVGMSVQIIDRLDDDDALKSTTMADIAKQLLTMYSGDPFARDTHKSPKRKSDESV